MDLVATAASIYAENKVKEMNPIRRVRDVIEQAFIDGYNSRYGKIESHGMPKEKVDTPKSKFIIMHDHHDECDHPGDRELKGDAQC